jgi:CheY-like chemotaxis protein
MELRQQSLSITLPPQPILLEADPTRLEQVFVNLLNNAAKYTDPGGRIELLVQPEGETVRLRLRDTGRGISPEVLPHIFDLFVQSERSLDRSEGGLGIGLTLVKRLVEMHGGTVAAHSDGIGQGSEFAVCLPTLPAERPDRSRTLRPAGGSEGRSVRVLLVEDNLDAARTLAELLELLGHEVRMAHDGPTALAIAAGYRPEVVLLDLGLPVMDGYEVARRLRQEAGLGEVRLVALTGYGQEEDRRRASEAGFDHHLVKPVELGAIQELLAEAYPLDRAASTSPRVSAACARQTPPNSAS